MSVTAHERPGVYSSYDASSVTRRSQGSRAIGIAAKAAKGTVGEVVTVTGYESGRAVFGEDSEGGGMTGLLRLLYENGASEVKAVRVAESGTVSDYTAAFRALAESGSARIVVTDSALTEVHQALRSHVETASENRRERIAIVGGSGSGKSTLLHLLMAGSTAYDGRILLDGTELREAAPESVYELISVIQQNVFVFNASIEENISMFRQFPQAELGDAIRHAHLGELLARRGQDSLCGENGCNLSGGEKQRISIARSLLKKSSVLLADEATAALDAQTAHQVSSDLLDLEGMTRIVVTHTLEQALLRRYDGILVLKNGEIAESGSFDELMARKGYFYALYTVSQ